MPPFWSNQHTGDSPYDLFSINTPVYLESEFNNPNVIAEVYYIKEGRDRGYPNYPEYRLRTADGRTVRGRPYERPEDDRDGWYGIMRLQKVRTGMVQPMTREQGKGEYRGDYRDHYRDDRGSSQRCNTDLM